MVKRQWKSDWKSEWRRLKRRVNGGHCSCLRHRLFRLIPRNFFIVPSDVGGKVRDDECGRWVALSICVLHSNPCCFIDQENNDTQRDVHDDVTDDFDVPDDDSVGKSCRQNCCFLFRWWSSSRRSHELCHHQAQWPPYHSKFVSAAAQSKRSSALWDAAVSLSPNVSI